ncbi:MAG: hypothetical protein GX939_04085 [Clostridiaceae bacterium]|mgnify:CR=1 FL=1|jgi:hypothetical protein|nr:hypothetical protein [Clostridiaceae bacterium]
MKLNNLLNSRTFRLGGMANYLTGAAAVLDFAGALHQYNYSASDHEADYLALKSDWDMVGEDLRYAMRRVV